MDVATLLRRQMELHTSMRQPPRTAAQLTQLRDTLHRYGAFVADVHALAARLSTQPHTVYQYLLHLHLDDGSSSSSNSSMRNGHMTSSNNGSSALASFDQQHGEGDVPMHQAKVLARAQAVALAPQLQRALSPEQLTRYAATSHALRRTLRVKVEDGNDLRSATQTLHDMTAYLDCIHACARGVATRMFALYMVEDAAALRRLLRDGAADGLLVDNNDDNEVNSDNDSNDDADVTAASCASLLAALQTACATAQWTMQSSATRRLCAARQLVRIVTELATRAARTAHAVSCAHTHTHDSNANDHDEDDECAVAVVCALRHAAPAIDALTRERRSALYRAGCDAIVAFASCASLWCCSATDDDNDDDNNNSSAHDEAHARAVHRVLTQWVQALVRGVYVTIAAVATASEAALRCLVMHTRAHDAVVAALLAALRTGTQAELRVCCLGCLALCVVAATTGSEATGATTTTMQHEHDGDARCLVRDASTRRAHNNNSNNSNSNNMTLSSVHVSGCRHTRDRAVTRLRTRLLPVATHYLGVGDARCRQRARALVAVLRVASTCRCCDDDGDGRACCDDVCGDDKTARLVQMESARLAPYVHSVHALDQVLFDARCPDTTTTTRRQRTCSVTHDTTRAHDKENARDEHADNNGRGRPVARLTQSLHRKIALARQAHEEQQQHAVADAAQHD